MQTPDSPAAYDLRPGGSSDRAQVRDLLYVLADESSNPAALRAVVDAWFYSPLSRESFAWSEDKLVEALSDGGSGCDVRLTEDEAEFCERFAGEHGIPALLDHLGLDGLANELVGRGQSASVLWTCYRCWTPVRWGEIHTCPNQQASVRVSLSDAEIANPERQRRLRKFLRLLDWARS